MVLIDSGATGGLFDTTYALELVTVLQIQVEAGDEVSIEVVVDVDIVDDDELSEKGGNDIGGQREDKF